MTTWTDGLPDERGYARYGTAPDAFPILVDHDWAGPYEFEQLVVWRHPMTGELRAAADSGCSCPTPFGDLTWEGMKPIREVDDLRPLLESLYGAPDWDDQDAGLADIKAKVHRHLRDTLPIIDGTVVEDAGELPAPPRALPSGEGA